MDAGKDPSGQAPGAPVRRLAGAAIRQAPVAAIALAAIWLLSERMAEVDPGALAAALRQTGWAGWLGAMALTAVSFRAVGRYDALVLAELAQGKADGGAELSFDMEAREVEVDSTLDVSEIIATVKGAGYEASQIG